MCFGVPLFSKGWFDWFVFKKFMCRCFDVYLNPGQGALMFVAKQQNVSYLFFFYYVAELQIGSSTCNSEREQDWIGSFHRDWVGFF